MNKRRLLLQGKQVSVLWPMIRYKLSREIKILEFPCLPLPDIFKRLFFLQQNGGDLNECSFLLLNKKSRQPLHNSGNWYFPTDQCYHIHRRSIQTDPKFQCNQAYWVEWGLPEKYIPALTARTGECDLKVGKRIFAGVIKLQISRGDHPGLPRWPLNPMTSILVGERREDMNTEEQSIWWWRQGLE